MHLARSSVYQAVRPSVRTVQAFNSKDVTNKISVNVPPGVACQFSVQTPEDKQTAAQYVGTGPTYCSYPVFKVNHSKRCTYHFAFFSQVSSVTLEPQTTISFTRHQTFRHGMLAACEFKH